MIGILWHHILSVGFYLISMHISHVFDMRAQIVVTDRVAKSQNPKLWTCEMENAAFSYILLCQLWYVDAFFGNKFITYNFMHQIIN